NDDAKITHKVLSDIIEKFVGKFGDKIANWSGDVRMFRDFEPVIDNILLNGKIAEIPLKIPILKIFEKDFVKKSKQISKKGLIVSEEDLRIVQDQKPEWTSKRLPTQVITQGFLDKNAYKIAHLADGFRKQAFHRLR
ncbi:MAG: hypothetical protein ACTSP9_07035, partial [Promethearchaeota archaeon]